MTPPVQGNIVKQPTEPAPTPDVPVDMPTKRATEVPPAQPEGEISLPQITGDDLRTEGLEPRFSTTLPRVPVQVPIPVSGEF